SKHISGQRQIPWASCEDLVKVLAPLARSAPTAPAAVAGPFQARRVGRRRLRDVPDEEDERPGTDTPKDLPGRLRGRYHGLDVTGVVHEPAAGTPVPAPLVHVLDVAEPPVGDP